MRILIINTLYPPFQVGGAEKSVSLLAEALVRSGDQVSVITLHPQRDHTVDELNGVRVHRIPLYNRYWPFHRKHKQNLLSRELWHLADMANRHAARAVGKVLDQENPEVVHTNNLLGLSVSIWRQVRRRNIRLVHTLRDYYLLCVRCSLFRNGNVCEQRCLDCQAMTVNRKPASHQVDAVVANSAFVLNQHHRHGYFKGVACSVIYNIADTSLPVLRLARAPGDRSLIFGFIGRLEAEKGIDVVLQATTLLVNPNWTLKIAGQGLDAYVSRLQQTFPDRRIEWLGFCSAADFYSSIDVSLIASVWAEPLPRTLIESFAAGKSAICAQSGGIPEIAPLGKVVETYPPRDPRALAALIDRALADPGRWRSGGLLHPDSLAIFSEASITAAYRAVYHAVYHARQTDATDG